MLADEHSLEDVLTHVLRNAGQHRAPRTPITLALALAAGEWQLTVHNRGPAITEVMLDRIFEYGVSGATSDPAHHGDATAPASPDAPALHRGQGLFVARTYMAKMGGTVRARNVGGGVAFVLGLPAAEAPV